MIIRLAIVMLCDESGKVVFLTSMGALVQQFSMASAASVLSINSMKAMVGLVSNNSSGMS